VEPLYQRVLGAKFAELHPTLRRFHSLPSGGTASGRFRVTHAPGRLRRLLLAVMRLPRAGDDVDVPLTVSLRGPGELWVRAFPGAPFVTIQTERRGLLMERSGPVVFGFILGVVDGSMTFTMTQFRVAGIPLPLWMGPSVNAVVVPNDTGWTVTVRMALPVFGHVLEYHGEVTPRWT
jgi:hypothetical protein